MGVDADHCRTMERSSCTEDRIQHVLERCLSDLGLDGPDKQLWNAGLCINRWCLEELVKRNSHNFLILLQKILRKTKQVQDQCQYHLVVPLCLLFSSTLLTAPYLSPDCQVVWEAYLLFHGFLSWPEPCGSASRRLLQVIQQELRAPGISFQRLVRTEQGVSSEVHSSRTIMVLLVSPDEDVPPEVRSVSRQLSSSSPSSSTDVMVTLLHHSFQAVLGSDQDLQGLLSSLQSKEPEELQLLLDAVTENMEIAASTGDFTTAVQGLQNNMKRLREGLRSSGPAHGCTDSETVKTLMLPPPRCHTRLWDDDTFDVLNDIIFSDSELDSPADCFTETELHRHDIIDASVDQEQLFEGHKMEQDFQSHRVSSSTSRASTFSNVCLSSSWSAPSASSGVDSDFSGDPEDGQEVQPKPRKKPKKKSRSLLGVERFSVLFRNPHSPNICRRAQSMGCSDVTKDLQRTGSARSRSRSRPAPPATGPLKHVCVRRRPILSCDESDVTVLPVQVKVVVFGGDKEAGRLARAYCHLQERASKCSRLTKMCKLHFYFVPTRRRSTGTEVQTGSPSRASSVENNDLVVKEGTTDIGQMLGMMDPWYDRNVLSLLSLSSDVLSQADCKEGTDSEDGRSREQLPLLADLVLYYCRHADQPVLVQLYQVELTLAGGEKKKEVFLQSLELGHSAGTRAVKALGAASKRLGIEEERRAVPLTLTVTFNKVAVSGRSQWIQTETACTSIDLQRGRRKHLWHDSRAESLQLTIKEVLKRNGSKAKKGLNQLISVSEVTVDRVQVEVGGEGTTFAVCLDQDEKKFIQSVSRTQNRVWFRDLGPLLQCLCFDCRCDVSLCCKPGSSSDWKSYQHLPGQVRPLHPSYCSLLCLPITSFSASNP
ncbi:phosphoinositide 3-kinase regulatory subunit 5-like isoform X2 [Cynoglossus semilaevis]|uniref:phosphoinositide 3-kinase regulatory subunit 5-like isoform X2 n=1 Tax=Cynoglossus semilaevis TaxID=244447 RepID=UPI000D623B15|nr:phosphoinositide 3-kinase regulatory subunit 5-like isoform X2 [Cynoglossus semilaevis]